MHPVRPALPELDSLRSEPQATPVLGHRHAAAFRVRRAQPRHRRVQLFAAGDDRRLRTGPGPELRAVRTGGEVGRCLGGAHPGGGPGHGYLPLHRVPREQQCAGGVGGELPALARGVVGEEDETPLVVGLEQDRPDARLALGRSRGVDIEDLVGRVSYGNVWGLLVDNRYHAGLPPAEPFPLPIRTGDPRVDVQSALAMLAPPWGLQPLLDIDEECARRELARASVLAMSFVAQSARGIGQPMVPEAQINDARTVVERMMIRWRGQPRPAHIKAVDAYFVSAAEHGMNASTFTARVVASTGADIAACLSSAVGALSGPLHGGARRAC